MSFNALDGRYLRPRDFTSLVSSGYIGSFAKTTEALKVLIEATLAAGNSVVAAIESK